MDGFWMEVERIQQKGEAKEEASGGSRSQLLEGEESWLTCKVDVRALFQARNVSGPTYDETCRISSLLGLLL